MRGFFSLTMWAVFFGIAGLAFLDSLNPYSIAAMALVLVGRNRLSRGLLFLGATFATYYIGGIALLAGWTRAQEQRSKNMNHIARALL
jgi:hypothetical protein